MKLFECQCCGQPLDFENTLCLGCGRTLGYLPLHNTLSALEPADAECWLAAADPGRLYRFCFNARYEVCNWVIAIDDPGNFCIACRHNRTIPDLSCPENLPRWRSIERAKHRLFYTLIDLGLPLRTRWERPDGLAFDFLADQPSASSGPVMTGHANGVITINVKEADDAERERRRGDMGEPYRTLLGHFRHEIAHYYWGRLIANSQTNLAAFRRTFGDERQDYSAALARHYADGPPANWPEDFVSAYASSHPWEDFAETWAHYLHMVDTLETASAFGIHVRPRVSKGAELAAKIDFDPHAADLDRILAAWLPLTFAVNSINRSMGLHDLYPFVLGARVIAKLQFVHDLIRAARSAVEQQPAPLRQWRGARNTRVIGDA